MQIAAGLFIAGLSFSVFAWGPSEFKVMLMVGLFLLASVYKE